MYGGNVYAALYEFRMTDVAYSSKGFEYCRALVPQTALSGTRLEDVVLEDQRVARTQVCFPPCRDDVVGAGVWE